MVINSLTTIIIINQLTFPLFIHIPYLDSALDTKLDAEHIIRNDLFVHTNKIAQSSPVPFNTKMENAKAEFIFSDPVHDSVRLRLVLAVMEWSENLSCGGRK